MKRKSKGLTLIELLVVLPLVGIVLAFTFSTLSFGKKTVDLGTNEYKLQAAMRLVAEKTNKLVRESSALFTIPKASFDTNLAAGWSYIGVKEVVITPADGTNPAVKGSEIVNYIYNPTGGHREEILLEAQPDITYKFEFKKGKTDINDNLVKLTIESYLNNNGAPIKKLSIDTELEGLNALQVIDYGTSLQAATAIAYRNDTRRQSVVGHIAMVLDTSGSMATDMNGYNYVPVSSQRITKLKTEAKKMINEFALESNIDISLVPFATSANSPKPFRNASSERDALLDDIDDLGATGGTNTGDGLRRAYYQLYDHNRTVGAGITPSNYVIVLVDGVTTYASVISKNNRNYLVDNSTINEYRLDREPYSPSGQVIGNGTTTINEVSGYVERTGSMLKNSSFAKVYVIGFSAISDEYASVNDIATSCGAQKVFKVGNEVELNKVFSEIRESIVNDLWFLQGPQL